MCLCVCVCVCVCVCTSAPKYRCEAGLPFIPFAFFSVIFDDEIAEGCPRRCHRHTGSSVTHMFYADDLTLMVNDLDAMQTMLNRLRWYAQRKHLINAAKSEVVHFNSFGSNAPVFNVGRVPLAHQDPFKYLGMMFYRRMNMIESSKHASAFWVRQLYVRNLR